MSRNCGAALLRHNQYEYLLVANCSAIQILDFPSNRLIDTLHGHSSVVTGIDASYTGTIVSISEANDVCFHAPLSTDLLKWELSFKTQMQGNLSVSTVKMSTIGDMCVMAGDRYISVWTQDQYLDSYTQQIFYSSDQEKVSQQMGQVIETIDSLTANIKQLEISGDGRLFVTLEENARSLKVWHQSNLWPAPSKDLKARIYHFEELSVHETQEQAPIESFRLKDKSPNQCMAEPCIFLTLSKYQINLYVESLMDTEMRFVCVKTIRISPRISQVQVVFIPQKIHCVPSMAQHPVLPHYLSKLFDTYRDEELKTKVNKGNPQYGLAPQFADSKAGLQQGHSDLDSFSFFVMEDSSTIALYRAQGISNVPMRNYEIELVKKVRNDPLQITLTQVVACVLQTQNSQQIKMVGQNDKGHIFLTEVDLNKCEIEVSSSFALEATQSQILLSRTHPEFTQLLALVHKDEIVLYFEQELLGKLPRSQGVKDLSWVPKLNQFLVLRQSSESELVVELISSSWLLKGKKPLEKPNSEQLDVYLQIHSLNVPSKTIGLEIVSLTQTDNQVSLHFTTLQSNGYTASFILNYQLQDSTLVEQTNSTQARLYQNQNMTTQVVCTHQSDNAAYVLILTELELGGRAQKIEQFLRFYRITTTAAEELWSCEVTVRHQVTAKLVNETLVVSVVEGEYGRCHYVLYIYSIKECRYLGYLRLSEMLQLPYLQGLKIQPMDFEQSANFRQITVLAADQAYLLKEKYGQWTVESSQPFSTFIHPSLKLHGPVAIVENYFVVQVPILKPLKYSSLPLYHPAMLKSFFFKGYSKQVAQILVEIQMHLQDQQKNPLPDLSSIKFEDEKPAPVVKKPFNAFADFDESEEDSENNMDDSGKAGKGKAAKEDDDVVLDYPTQLLDKFDDLLKGLLSEDSPLRLSKLEVYQMVEFLYQFRPLIKMDFYCDKLATHVLLQVYLETEKCSQVDMESSKIDLGLVQTSLGTQDTLDKDGQRKKGGFDMEEFIANKMGQASIRTEVDKSKVADWTSTQVCMALYSENQDVILDQLSQRLEFEQSLTWGLMRKLSIPLWLKSDAKLKQLIEKIAKNEYRLFDPDGHQSKPEYAALWYVLIGKIQVIKQLFNVEIDGKNFVSFLSSDFTQEKPRKVAGKNAMALASKRKNLLACAFYLLGQDLAGAVQVALERCKDPMLAFVMCRIHDPQNEKKQIDLIANEYFIKRGTQFNDPYLKSIGQWLLQEYVKAVNELTPKRISSVDQLFKEVKVFNLAKKTSDTREEVKKPAGSPQQEATEFPKTQQTSYESLDLLARLRKVPEVKKVLNKDWQLDKKSKAGGGMFDDLLGSEESSEEEQVVEEKEVINVDETFLLEQILETLLESGHTSLAQILIKENLQTQMSKDLKQKIASIQITDVMLIPHVNVEMISASMRQLTEQLAIGVDMDFVVRQFTALENMFYVEIEFLVQSGAGQKIVQQMIEKESEPLAKFVKSSSMYCGRLLQADDRDLEGSKKLKIMAELVQSISDSLIQTQSLRSVTEQTTKEPLVAAGVRSSPAPKLLESKAKGHNNAFFGDDSDEEDNESHRPEEEASPNQPSSSQLTKSSKFFASTIQDKLNELTFKCKMGVLLTSTLFQLCLMINKFSLLPYVVQELTSFLQAWNWSAATVTETEVLKQIEKIQFLNVLQITLNVITSIKKNIEHADQEPKPTIRRKANKYQYVECKAVYEFFAHWLKHNCAYGLQNMVLHNGSRILGNKKTATQLQQAEVRLCQADLLGFQDIDRNGFTPSVLAKILQDQFEAYEKAAVLALTFKCNSQQRQALVTDLQAYMSKERFDAKANILDMRFYIKSNEKLKQFCKVFAVKKYLPQIQDLYLSQLQQVNDFEIEQEPLEKNGIELFRQRGEPVPEFCLKGDSIAIALGAKGMREISITCSLGFRNRTAAYDLVDEELFSWFDCLHRFDPIIQYQIEPTSDAIRQAILAHQMKKSLSSIVMQKPSVSVTNQKLWDGRPESDYTKQVSQLDITHEDFSSAICEHPQLPIYLTGNAKGIICVWHFSQQKNQSLNQWMLEPEIAPKDASAKKSTVKKIQFTAYGDKFVSLNAEGSLFLHSFDLSEDHSALFVFKGHKVSDFGMMDQDGTVIAALSQSNKALMIFDCMTMDTLAQSKVAGNLMQVDSQRQCIYTFNSKSGTIQRHDMRLQVTMTKLLHKEDVTASVFCGHGMRSLMVGFSDGTIRVYDADEAATAKDDKWEAKQTIAAFVNVGGKKGAVTCLKVHAETGAVYGSSSQGNIKLLRVQM